ncbi:MAG: (Fe-S)-binding protein [Thermodesulfobacteriota bacterium]
MQYQEILHRCFRCGFCKLPGNYTDINCPSYLKYGFESFAPGGRMWLIRAWLEGRIQNSSRLQEIFFSCATCNNCVQHCAFPKFKDDILKAFISAKTEMVQQGTLPPRVRDYLTRLLEHGNPYKIPQKKRGQWAAAINAEEYSNQEYLFYVGDIGSFDPRGREIAANVANVLQRMGVSFGILGSRELSDGNEALALGETDLFQYLAEKNIQTMQKLGVQKIITLCPHAYNALKNDYPDHGGQFQVLHYTQLLSKLLPAMQGLQQAGANQTTQVTLHDSCYLGRHNQDYQSPRQILRSLPGIELLEMDRCRENALCCGGGGGNFFTDLVSSGPETSAKSRVREAAQSKAEILVTSCPACTIMLEDALKSEKLDHRLQIQEISELISLYL